MNPLLRNLLFTAAVALVAGFAGAQLSGLYDARSQDEPDPYLRQTVSNVVLEELQLTPDQRSEIATIEDRFLQQRARTRSRITEANARLADAMSRDMEFGPATEAATEEIRSAFGDLQLETVMYALTVRAVLDPDQQRIFDQRISNVLNDEAP